MLHGIERSVEFACKATGGGPLMHRREQDGADVGGKDAERGEDDEHHHREIGMIAVALEQQAANDQRQGDDELDGEQALEAEIAGDDADHAAHGHHKGDELHGGVVDEDEAGKTPTAGEKREWRGTVGRAQFPARGGLDILGADLRPLEGGHVDVAVDGDQDEAAGNRPQHGRSGLECRYSRAKYAGRRPHDHRAAIFVDRLDD